VAVEQVGHSFNDPWCIDRLTLEIFHDVEKSIVYIRLVAEPNLDLIEVAQGVIEDGLLTVRHLSWRGHGRGTRTECLAWWRSLCRCLLVQVLRLSLRVMRSCTAENTGID
jgi:hypothetical protein